MPGLKVSILIPFKNTAEYLTECLESIVNQTYTNWEVIAVNDNSTDQSDQVVKEFAERDPRIKCFENEGNGIIEGLQTAYKHAIGHFITRMDSDDIMQPHKIEYMTNDLKKYGEGHIALGLVKYFSQHGINDGYQRYEKWLNRLIATGDNFTEIYKECVIPSPCWMVSRVDFDRAGGFNSSIYPEDYDLTFRFFESGLKCIPSNHLLHLWRDYPVRTSRTSPNYAENTFLELKLFYFLKLSLNVEKTLVLWGAGKKGKTIATLLIKQKVPFIWVCDNPKKIGKNIYGQRLKSWSILSDLQNTQSIVSVANSESQQQIKNYLTKQAKKPFVDYFFFC